MMLQEIPWLAVALSAVTTFVLGGAWYSPAMFLGVWQRASDTDPKKADDHHAPWTYLYALAASFVAAAVLALHLGPHPGLVHAVTTCGTAGVGLVATSFAINYAFGGRKLALWLVDAGYHVVQFLVFGVVLGAWPW